MLYEVITYGDTSQDGVWYSGHPFDVLGYEFGEKPFDPFSDVPDAENEDDEWVFPLASPFDFAGNDVIDASALFAVTLRLTVVEAPGANVTEAGFVAEASNAVLSVRNNFV